METFLEEVIRMKKRIGILVVLSLLLAFSLPAYAQQKAKPTPTGKVEADKMMEECIEMMDAIVARMEEMYEKMQKGEMQADAAKMKKLQNSISTVDKALNEIQMKGN
jgi:competence protein ComGC